MRDQKVLIVTYYWPPSGGAAVQRWLSFANKLVHAGWEVYILTVDERFATYQLRDETLSSQIDSRIQVHTTKTFEPFGFYQYLFGKNSIPKPAFSNETDPSFTKKIARFIRGNFFIPDPRKGWKKYAVPKALSIIKSHDIRNVITAGPPHSTHFIGREIKSTKRVKWIADFHDLWTDVIYYDMLYHLPIVKKIDLKLEQNILENADLVFTVGDQYREKLLSKSDRLDEKKFEVIRIGYDETDFKKQASEQPEQEKFIITYTGSIADYYQPGIFIEALKNVLPQHLSVPVLLRFIGVLSGGVRQLIIDAGLEYILDEKGYVSHGEAIEYLRQSTILLLVNPVTRDEAMVIPGKLYEYLAAEKPIINVTKLTAETAKIINECGAGKTFDRGMQEGLEAYLNHLLTEWLQTKNLDLSSNEIHKIYSRGAITQQLIICLDKG
jgi:glycosyltransferase involved in cell wall biosynthesis